MRRLIAVLLIMILTLSGCTRLPPSEETGVKPGQYKSTTDSEKLKQENNTLKEELDTAKKELENLKNDYLTLSKNNNDIISQLSDAQSTLKLLTNDNILKFKTEKTDKNTILLYLTEKKKLLDNYYREIELIPVNNESLIIFAAKGYSENTNQIFLWEVGNTEPIMIDGACFYQNGSWSWLKEDRYIIIHTGRADENKILDIDSKKVISTFVSDADTYLFPNTSTLLVHSDGKFELYDFLCNTSKELDINDKNKYFKYDVDESNDTLVLSGYYEDSENNIKYYVRADLDIAKLKEKYEIKNVIQDKDEEPEIKNVDGEKSQSAGKE